MASSPKLTKQLSVSLMEFCAREAIAVVKPMTVSIMPYQEWQFDALDTPALIVMGLNFRGGQHLLLSRLLAKIRSIEKTRIRIGGQYRC